MTTVEKWWLTDYACDIHTYMREKETRRAVFHMQSPSLNCRPRLVDWLTQICERYTLCIPVLHLAVYLMDYFMDNFYIQTDQLLLVALGCLLLAAKSEGRDALVPRASELNQHVQDAYHLSQFLSMEMTLLEFFHWDLVMPTTAHFLEYYLVYAITGNDSHEGRPLPSLAHGKMYITRYSHYFQKVSLRDQRFLRFPPSLIASSCIAASRICLFLTPTWPQILCRVTFYKSETLGPCIELLLRFLEDDEKEVNNKKRKLQH